MTPIKKVTKQKQVSNFIDSLFQYSEKETKKKNKKKKNHEVFWKLLTLNKI